MTAHLLIHDGSPHWWLSPDIWIVPGTDPNGPPGPPIAGQAAYLWARVSNTGNTAASGTHVDFYWADPSAQVVVGTANLIGSAFVDLVPGDTQDVLCLVPWIPVIVNDGHECVIAVAHAPGDTKPLPDPLPKGYLFDPPAHDQIGQLNLSVVPAARMSMPLVLTVNAINRVDKRAFLEVEWGEALDERTLTQLGLHGMRPARQRYVEASLHSEPPSCREPAAAQGKRELEVYVKRGTSIPIYISLHAPHLPDGEYQLLHVVERGAEGIRGGVSYAVSNKNGHEYEAKEQQS